MTSSSVPSAHLRTADAVELAYGLVQLRATQAAIRVLFVKGPVANYHQTRPQRTSADADVLVEPRRYQDFIALLGADEWFERPKAELLSRVTEHSITLINQTWPCDIDVHEFFPGFLADPAEVFELLWQRRTPVQVANRICYGTDLLGSILIQGLHSIRSSTSNQRHPAELAYLYDDVAPRLSEQDKNALRELCEATGADFTLGGLLEKLGVPLATRPLPAKWRDKAIAWHARVQSDSTGAGQWITSIRKMVWWKRPYFLFRILWPTEADFRIGRFDLEPGWLAGFIGRWKRIIKGLGQLPRAVRSRSKASRTTDLRDAPLTKHLKD